MSLIISYPGDLAEFTESHLREKVQKYQKFTVTGTDPHTEGCQTPAGPVHHVEEEETCNGDEVGF